jgi:glycosyltransferase involved in cell wall biosynthesis
VGVQAGLIPVVMDGGKISIVIPCYNHGSFLKEALSSVGQFRNENICEVIIVNDGSTDAETCKLLQELAGSEYKVIHQPNRGLGAARNTGIAEAKGEFILPLDSDNRIRSAYVAEGVKWLAQNPKAGVVYGDAEYFGEKTGKWKVPEFNLRMLVMGNSIDACALYRREVWESIGGYDEKMPWMGWEDWDFWLRVAGRGWKFMHLDRTAFDYRVRGSSMLAETDRHHKELVKYIFEKPENQTLAIIRRQNQEIEKFWKKENDLEYRIARQIARPAKYIRRIFANNKVGQVERVQDIEV